MQYDECLCDCVFVYLCVFQEYKYRKRVSEGENVFVSVRTDNGLEVTLKIGRKREDFDMVRIE